jgi:8-hydroxy-5-deazaflavin:NADPH oxidoreductase
MNIGIIGAGKIGATAAQLFIQAGHRVALSNSRGPESLQALLQQLGDQAQAMTIDDAARFGEVVLVAIPLGQFKSLPAAALTGKLVIDANNYYPGRDGRIPELEQGNLTSSELLQQHLQQSRLVKGFNTIWYEHLKTQGNTALPHADRRAIFIAGDDTAAKAVVADLIAQIGFAAVDTGSLRESARQQPDAPIYNQVLTAAQAAAMGYGV